MSDQRLQGKVALVSGGATGIGAAVVRRFAREGAAIVFGDINEEAGAALQREITASGGQARFVPLDVTDRGQWKAAIDATVQAHGRLDVLVNNAGIYARTPLEDITDDEFDRIMDVNVKGVFIGAQCAIPAMRQSGGGSIINLSSVAGMRGSVATHYGASKGAVRLMTKSIALQCAKDNIRCNSVHPGPVDTAMGHQAVPEEARAARFARTLLGRFAQPEEIAGAVFFLASDDSTYMTGSELVIDGGTTAG
jgi:NAD(P)-dependent dehydrogenase (short-subunit alcohol dehydrogenase family)